MSRPIQAQIDWDALRHNLSVARRYAPHQRVLAVIKADAYGHGLVRAAQSLDQADAFAVASLEEALCLREARVLKPIVLLEGFFEPAELASLARHRLHSVVHSPHQVEQLCQTPLPAPIQVWLKLNSGMQRLGFRPEAFPTAWQRLSACPQVVKPLRLMTHLASADEVNNVFTLRQLECFAAATAGLQAERSIANSAAIMAWPQTHADWVRPGVMLYGASPFADREGPELGLRPVMHLRSRLISVNACRRGDAVGYGGTWVCPEDMPVGVVAVGYGDGYPRHAPSGTPVLVNGQVAPLVGRVSMDMISVDLRGQPQSRPGDPVLLWGEGLPVDRVAAHAGTIAYQLLTGVTPRVGRV